jgi:redox-sensitive bicupin YhaK (pirin superfamily)
MIRVRRSAERGHANHGWLDSFHTFSFAGYHDPEHMGFRNLRVINEDRVAPGAGFGTHPHRDMEIITYVLEGALEHQDSLGNQSIIRPGEVQRMTAGTGIRHSEFNASPVEPVHLLQIWILPERDGLQPGYAQQSFSLEALSHGFRLVAGKGGRDGSVPLHADAELYAARLVPGQSAGQPLAPGRDAWLQVARGSVTVQGLQFAAGDGAAISGEEHVTATAGEAGAEVLLFDLPGE